MQGAEFSDEGGVVYTNLTMMVLRSEFLQLVPFARGKSLVNTKVSKRLRSFV